MNNKIDFWSIGLTWPHKTDQWPRALIHATWTQERSDHMLRFCLFYFTSWVPVVATGHISFIIRLRIQNHQNTLGISIILKILLERQPNENHIRKKTIMISNDTILSNSICWLPAFLLGLPTRHIFHFTPAKTINNILAIVVVPLMSVEQST
jgi:hypothetical protein